MSEKNCRGILRHRWFDRGVAAIAIAPFLLQASIFIYHHGMDFVFFSMIVQLILLAATMVWRRPPKDVTVNPLYWLLTIFETYWLFAVSCLHLFNWGHPLLSREICDGLAALSLVLGVMARLSLGFNIGLLPAKREIVKTGTYRFLRHPIYTAIFLSVLARLLGHFSFRNAMLYGWAIVFFALKCLAEEDFLKKDEVYRQYMEQTRWRWIPWLV